MSQLEPAQQGHLAALRELRLVQGHHHQEGHRSIGGVHVNFVAKFDIDDGPTDLSLELAEYDASPLAAYQSWLLLEPDEP